MRNIREMTQGLGKPAVQVTAVEGATLSHFGGSPHLPAGIDWPEKDGERLAFLARLSLPEIQRVSAIDWLPASGALLFFYDIEEQPWGYDPRDRGAWAVLHVPDLEGPAASHPQDEDSPVPFTGIGFHRIETLPSCQRDAVAALELSEGENGEYSDLTEIPYQGKPRHQISGFPAPVQGDDMELECQLASNGLYCGNETGYNDPRALSLQSGADDWRLLFQLDSDDDLDVMWGDCGTLYFWVREQAARAGDFGDAWLVLQCC